MGFAHISGSDTQRLQLHAQRVVGLGHGDMVDTWHDPTYRGGCQPKPKVSFVPGVVQFLCFLDLAVYLVFARLHFSIFLLLSIVQWGGVNEVEIFVSFSRTCLFLLCLFVLHVKKLWWKQEFNYHTFVKKKLFCPPLGPRISTLWFNCNFQLSC